VHRVAREAGLRRAFFAAARVIDEAVTIIVDTIAARLDPWRRRLSILLAPDVSRVAVLGNRPPVSGGGRVPVPSR
jgi:hypothetical protein